MARVYSISKPTGMADPLADDGLRAAVSAALDYALAVVERDEELPPSIPVVLLVQTRRAARHGIGLHTVLRCCFAGYALFDDFLLEVAKATPQSPDLRLLFRAQAAHFDHLISSISEEYQREENRRLHTLDQRRLKLVQRLLGGELFDHTNLAYGFDAWHLGILALGPDVASRLAILAAELDRVLLLVSPDEETSWAWLGGRRRLSSQVMSRHLSTWPQHLRAAIGEPARGIAGWRLSHQQAKTASLVAQRSGKAGVRYADVALLAAVLRDDTLAASLRQLYLEPLELERDGGQTLRETLQAYIDAQQNGASAAAALGVSRQTVNNRLRAAEDRIGRSVIASAAEIDLALRLWKLSCVQSGEAHGA